MSISQQRINFLKIKKLKNLKDCTIDFSNKPLVAIMGVNGVGKSTILHALACCYKPTSITRKDYKFSEFFYQIHTHFGTIVIFQSFAHIEIILAFLTR